MNKEFIFLKDFPFILLLSYSLDSHNGYLNWFWPFLNENMSGAC